MYWIMLSTSIKEEISIDICVIWFVSQAVCQIIIYSAIFLSWIDSMCRSPQCSAGIGSR